MERHMDLLLKQEELLRFDRFTHADAFNLGLLMVRRAESLGIVIAVSIRSLDGAVLFQYLPDGTNRNNQNWMRRKTNTVILMEKSSLRAALEMEAKKQTIEDQGYSLADYALCGGGFPVRLKDGSMAGVVTASNLYHIADHEFVTGCLREYLSCPEAPEYPYTLP